MSKGYGLNNKWIFASVILGMMIIFASVFIFSWSIKSELGSLYMLGNQLNKELDINKTLEVLISENKLISAREFFGFYISYYNNYIVILSCIIAAFGVASLFYIRGKNEEVNQKLINKAQERVDSFLHNKIGASLEDFSNRLEELDRKVKILEDKVEVQDLDKELTKE